jgi:hypothetical protein
VTRMKPVVRSIGYHITWIGGLVLTSLQAGFQAADYTVDGYPVWLKIALGAWPAWCSAFGLTAASHVPDSEERYRGYVPDRVLEEDETTVEGTRKEVEEVHGVWLGDRWYEADDEGNVDMTKEGRTRDELEDTFPDQPKLFRKERKPE